MANASWCYQSPERDVSDLQSQQEYRRKRSHLKFIHHWIPELQGYSLDEISHGKYTDSYYPQPIIDWAQTRKVNGKIVADLRNKVKTRLIERGGDEYESAVAAKETVEKYWQYQDKEYLKYRSS